MTNLCKMIPYNKNPKNNNHLLIKIKLKKT